MVGMHNLCAEIAVIFKKKAALSVIMRMIFVSYYMMDGKSRLAKGGVMIYYPP